MAALSSGERKRKRRNNNKKREKTREPALKMSEASSLFGTHKKTQLGEQNILGYFEIFVFFPLFFIYIYIYILKK
jgi:hypothetical protein